MEKANFLKYSVSGRLAKLLGRESVSTDEAALFELVKNSYDADATKAIIRFEDIDLFQKEHKKLKEILDEKLRKLTTEHSNLSHHELKQLVSRDPEYLEQEHIMYAAKKKSKIVLYDNGTGMTLDQIKNKWMKIGVKKELDEKFTQKGRRVVGEKGVGRFAVEKLARIVIIKSRPKKSKSAIIFSCDWDKIENSEKNLTEIKIPFSYERKNETDHGLTILMKDVRASWTEKKIENFLTQLSVLILPKTHVISDFSIVVAYKKGEKYKRTEIQSELQKIAPYKFEAELLENSMIKFSSLIYKNEQIIPNKRKKDYEIKEEFSFVRYGEEEDRRGKSEVAMCGPVKFTFYGFPFDPSGRDLGWSDWYGKTKVDKIQQDVEFASGIKIYRDGFRVRPYGDLNNDWLGTGSRARAAAGKLPPKNTIGWVEISRDSNSAILDTTTREKIIENEAFSDLKDFVAECLRRYYLFSEKRRQEIIKKESLRESPSMVSKLTILVKNDASIPKKTKQSLIKSLNEIQNRLSGEEKAFQNIKYELMDEVGAYRNLASLGITTGAVAHEVKDYLKKINLHTLVLKKGLKNIDKNMLEESLNVIEPSVKNLSDYMELVSGFTSDLTSRKKEFRQKKRINLFQAVKEIKKSLSALFDRWDVDFQNEVSNQFPKLFMYKADIQSILLNLVSNSIKSLKILSAERKDKPKKGIIRISTLTKGDELTIYFSDNGIGIAEIDKDLVFDLFWTRTATNQTVKSGSGLGLPIIKEIVNDYGGKISIEKPELDHGVTFKIVLPKKEIVK